MGKRCTLPAVHPRIEDEASQTAFLQHNRATCIDIARTGYRDEGRGGIVVQSANATDAGVLVTYISDRAVQLAGARWPDVPTTLIVAAYDPICEFVVVFLRTDQRTSTYKIRY